MRRFLGITAKGYRVYDMWCTMVHHGAEWCHEEIDNSCSPKHFNPNSYR
jgi:hypothetical protein